MGIRQVRNAQSGASLSGSARFGQSPPMTSESPQRPAPFRLPARPAMPSGSATMTDLFTPLKLGHLELPNRVLMAPLTRCRAEPDRHRRR